MKNSLFFFLLMLLGLIASCDRVDDDVEEFDIKELPACIQEMIDDEDLILQISSVSLQRVNGEYQYLVDYLVLDVNRNIFNDDCELQCYYTYGLPHPSGCIDNYDVDNWETIWER